MHCSIEHGGFEHELHAIVGKGDGQRRRIAAEAPRQPRSHSPRRRPCSRSSRTSERRGRLAELVAAVQEGELGEEDAQALEEMLELGLSTGRIRGSTAPRASRPC